MITQIERRLAEFVNRESEMEIFCEMLETGDRPILSIWGDGGVGKSSLLARMIHECAIRKVRKSEIIWTETRNHDYLAIMRKIRDDIGPVFFKPFTDLVNFYTVPQYKLHIKLDNTGDITVAKKAQIQESEVGDIAGVIIKDSMLVMPRTDMAVPESERMARLTDLFIENFTIAIETGPPIIVFLDAIEKMTENTHNWLWGEFLKSVQNNRLKNIRVILCGRNEPKLDRDMQFVVKEAALCPLETANIIEYLDKRGIGENSQADLATMLMVTTKGNPLQIATFVDGFLRLRKRQAS